MQKKSNVFASLAAAVALAACSTTPPQNSLLSEARASYRAAQTNTQVTQLAPIELKQAGERLAMADDAARKGEPEATINRYAYLAKQKVAIAQETAKRKAAEAAISDATAQRDRVRLEARTAEADAAKRRAEEAQRVADERAAALAQANAQTERDQAVISARMAELEEAKRQATEAQQMAEQQAAALTQVTAQSERDRQLIAEQQKQLKELEELNAKQTNRGMVVTLGDVLFNVGKAELAAAGTGNVKKLAAFLQAHPERKVSIEGHTDSTGSDSYNQSLSERRAEAVRNALVELGISGDRLATRGYGESTPLANNETAAGRQMNRRVEIVLSDEKGNVIPR